MSRQSIPKQIETELLLSCRRRCAICYGLHRDNRIKQGQIAHLNQRPDNNVLENLCFLCLDHHDIYDSRTSQSKKLTIEEVKAFKAEIEEHIREMWNRPIVSIREIKVDIFTGCYESGNEFAGAEIYVSFLGGNLIHIKGTSLWGKTREYGPNIGELDFVSQVELNKASFADTLNGEEYLIEFEFLGDRLIAKEKYLIGYFGHNVYFEGMYRRLR